MLENLISFTLGTGVSALIAATACKFSLKKQLASSAHGFTQQLNEIDLDKKQLQNKINSLETKIEEQKTLTVGMISNAFHTGSELMEQMSAGLGEIQGQVNSTCDPINNIHDASTSAQSMIQKSQNSMQNLSTSITGLHDLTALVSKLCDHMNQVNQKSQVIHNIANQANLLSLNAAIEAARAGEAGRGFGVVANDMNRLSELSATSAQEISQILSSGLKDIETITFEMNNKVEIFSAASDSVMTCFGKMHEVINSISEITDTLNTTSTCALDNVKQVSNQTQTNMEMLTKILSDVTGKISGNSIHDISPAQAKDSLGDFKIIDVRRPQEFNDELGHINGATLYCLQDNFKQAISGLDRNANYLFVCRSGGRSARGARIAQAMGFKHVSNLAGGMLEWRKVFPKAS